MKAHSADVCQCNSRTPPAVSLMFTPARVFETGSSRTVTSRDHPPSYVRLFAKENGYLKFCTRLFESVPGGQMESSFWPSSPELAGPGSVLLRSAPTTFCNAAKLPIATAVFPMKLLRVYAFIICLLGSDAFEIWNCSCQVPQS